MVLNSNYVIEKINKLNENPSCQNEDELCTLIKNGTISDETLIAAFKDLRLKLGEHMKLDRIQFLFGNGVSIYAGSKNTMGFTLSEYIDQQEFCAIKEEIQRIAELEGVENQLNALIITKAYFDIINDTRSEVVEKLIQEIKKRLINDFVNSVDYGNLSYHEMLLLKLRAFACINRTEIFTPNYDLAFEYVLDKLSIDYEDGFSGFINRQFNPRVFVERKKTALVKIHGSVNWVLEGTRIKEIQPDFSEGKVRIDDTKPVLIYPTSGKLYQTFATPYSELMRYMLDGMETGNNTIIVLGYKYGDEHINEVLLKALQNPRNIFYFFVFGELAECDFASDMAKLAESMPNINVISGKILSDFVVFTKYILPATPEKTDEEKALELLQKVLSKDAE